MTLSRTLPPVSATRFAMVPRPDVPRSTFVTQSKRKLTFDGGFLVPLYIKEVLPGDVHQGEIVIFARMNNLLFPIMDNVILETFFFFVPNRLVWDNWVKLMGERKNPGDSISYTVPQVVSAAGGFAVSSIYDYMGLPTVGQVTAGQTVSVSALPNRGYCLIWDEWFRSQDLDNSLSASKGDGPDNVAAYQLMRRRKYHDYFTTALPAPLKGPEPVLPIGGMANVKGIATLVTVDPSDGTPGSALETGGSAPNAWAGFFSTNAAGISVRAAQATAAGPPLVQADLSTAGGSFLNAWRIAIATQHLLEKDARGGTRYAESLRMQFGVEPEDARLQRPEYIGGGRTLMDTQAIPQTSATGITGGTTPAGSLVGQATAAGQHRWRCYAREHGYIIGLIHAGAELTYQQGLHRMWTRKTRAEFYTPVFANIGEQAIRNDEIYCTGMDVTDEAVFGYKEAWAEYRYEPSTLAGLFRSTSAGSIDKWHLAINFGSAPALNANFIQDTPPFARVLAAGTQADGMQIIMDSVARVRCTRAMPTYSVPGLDRF